MSMSYGSLMELISIQIGKGRFMGFGATVGKVGGVI